MRRLVVKVGGHSLDNLESTSATLMDLAFDVGQLRAGGTEVVIVHGGGPQIAELLARVGEKSDFVDGHRVTSAQTMELVVMALSKVNVMVTAALNQAGLRAVGLCGVDDSLLSATAKGPVWDRAGTGPRVHADIVTALWSLGVTAVISPIAVDDRGGLLNVNADTVAGSLASALDADALVLLSDVDQLLADPVDPSSGFADVRADALRDVVARGAVKDGMLPKAQAALEALEGGARRVVIANGVRPHALRDSVSGAIPTTEVWP